MIQLAAPSAAAAPAGPAVMPAIPADGGAAMPVGLADDTPGRPAGMPQSAAFAGLLAQQLDVAGTAAEKPAADPNMSAEPAGGQTGARALLAQLAAALHGGGKLLPGAGKAVPAGKASGEPATATDAEGDSAAALSDPAAALNSAPVFFPLIAPGILPATPAATGPAAAPQPPRDDADGRAHGDAPTSRGPVLPPLVEAQLLGRPLDRAIAASADQLAPAQTPAQMQAQSEIRPLAIDRAASAAAPFVLSESAAPQGPGAVRLRPLLAASIDTERTVAAASALTMPDIMAAATMQAPAEGGMSAIGGTAPTNTAAQGAGHDFAALVDRLIAARDASQPGVGQHGTQVAVHHADFGQVSLNFRHDAEGLTVSVASPDPDFARAVQAATAGGGAGGAELSSGQNGHNAASGQSAAQSQGGGQGRSNGAGRASASPADNQPAPPREETAPSTRRGVFA